MSPSTAVHLESCLSPNPALPQLLSCVFLVTCGHIVLVPQEAFFSIQFKIQSPGHIGWETGDVPPPSPRPAYSYLLETKNTPRVTQRNMCTKQLLFERRVCQNQNGAPASTWQPEVGLAFILRQVVIVSFPRWLGSHLTVFSDGLVLKESAQRE